MTDLIAQVIMLSGSYMLYGAIWRAAEETFAACAIPRQITAGAWTIRVATLRPQILQLDENCVRWNRWRNGWPTGWRCLWRLLKLQPARPVAAPFSFFLKAVSLGH